jgi:hypothetical protein
VWHAKRGGRNNWSVLAISGAVNWGRQRREDRVAEVNWEKKEIVAWYEI